MTWWEDQERDGYRWWCGVCEQRTPIQATAPRHKPGCPYAEVQDG